MLNFSTGWEKCVFGAKEAHFGRTGGHGAPKGAKWVIFDLKMGVQVGIGLLRAFWASFKPTPGPDLSRPAGLEAWGVPEEV